MIEAPSEEPSGVGAEDTIVRSRESTPSGMNRPDRLLTQRAFVEVTAGTYPGQRFYLERRDYVLGRSQEADILLADESISRYHCRLVWRNDEYVLQDLGSKNGTFLNGTSVQECPLRAGDEIMLGNHALRFLYETVLTPSR